MSKSMTPEGAIEILKGLTFVKVLENNAHSNIAYHSESDCKKDNEDFAAIQMAISALEYRTPKKSIVKNIGELKIPDTAFCPICDNPVIKDEADNYEQAYCCYCGQALDWSDEE